MKLKIRNVDFEINNLMFDDAAWKNNGKENIKYMIKRYLKDALVDAYNQGYELKEGGEKSK